MNKDEVKEQIQEDILSVLEEFDVDMLSYEEFEELKDALCQVVINGINKMA